LRRIAFTKLPNRYYSELLIAEKNLIEAYNGKSAWHQNAAGELGTLVGPEGMQLEAAAQYYNSRLVNPKKSKSALTFVAPKSEGFCFQGKRLLYGREPDGVRAEPGKQKTRSCRTQELA
jgi:hypothetical protein